MTPRHNVAIDSCNGTDKPPRRSPRQKAQGCRRRYSNGYVRTTSGRNSPTLLDLFRKATKRTPRRFTKTRQEKLQQFLKDWSKNEQECGKFGSPSWMDSVIKMLDARKRYSLLHDDVTYWMQTEDFFKKYRKRVRFASPAASEKNKSPPPPPYTESSSSESSACGNESDEDLNEDVQNEHTPCHILVKKEIGEQAIDNSSPAPGTPGCSASSRKPLSAIQWQAAAQQPNSVSAFSGRVAADEPPTNGAVLTSQVDQVPVNNCIQQPLPISVPFAQMGLDTLVQESLSVSPVNAPLLTDLVPADFNHPQVSPLQNDHLGSPLFTTEDGQYQFFVDPSVITLENMVEISNPSPTTPTSQSTPAVVPTATMSTDTVAVSSSNVTLPLEGEALDQVLKTSCEALATASIVLTQPAEAPNPQDILKWYTETIVRMVDKLRKSGSTAVNTEGCFHAVSLLNMCIRNKI